MADAESASFDQGKQSQAASLLTLFAQLEVKLSIQVHRLLEGSVLFWDQAFPRLIESLTSRSRRASTLRTTPAVDRKAPVMVAVSPTILSLDVRSS